MIKVLVTGAGGQIAEELRELSMRISNPWINFVFLNKAELDIANIDQTKLQLKNHLPQYIINTAAYTKVDQAEKESEYCYSVNLDAAIHLAITCKNQNIRFIHFSSDYVFHDLHNHQPYKEDHLKNPQGVYAKSKSMAEDKIMELNSDATILRCSWIYSSYGHNFVKTILKLSKTHNEIKVVNDQIGSPTYAANIAELLLDIIYHEVIKDKKINGIYHYCNEGFTSWYDFAKSIIEISNLETDILPISTKEYNALALRPPYSVLDCSKIKNALGISIPFWTDSLKLCLNKMHIG